LDHSCHQYGIYQLIYLIFCHNMLYFDLHLKKYAVCVWCYFIIQLRKQLYRKTINCLSMLLLSHILCSTFLRSLSLDFSGVRLTSVTFQFSWRLLACQLSIAWLFLPNLGCFTQICGHYLLAWDNSKYYSHKMTVFTLSAFSVRWILFFFKCWYPQSLYSFLWLLILSLLQLAH
jgi:hypothetical protein